MLEILFWLVFTVIAFFISGTRVFLQGQDLSVFDRSIESSMWSGEPSEQHYNSIDSIAGLLEAGNEHKDRKTQLSESRVAMDEWGASADMSGIRLENVDANGHLDNDVSDIYFSIHDLPLHHDQVILQDLSSFELLTQVLSMLHQVTSTVY